MGRLGFRPRFFYLWTLYAFYYLSMLVRALFAYVIENYYFLYIKLIYFYFFSFICFNTQFKEYISYWLHHQVATSEIKVRMLCGTSGKAALQEADLVGKGPFCLPAFLPFTFLKNETALRMEGWQSREK